MEPWVPDLGRARTLPSQFSMAGNEAMGTDYVSLFSNDFLVLSDYWLSVDAYGQDQRARVLDESHEFKDTCT